MVIEVGRLVERCWVGSNSIHHCKRARLNILGLDSDSDGYISVRVNLCSIFFFFFFFLILFFILKSAYPNFCMRYSAAEHSKTFNRLSYFASD